MATWRQTLFVFSSHISTWNELRKWQPWWTSGEEWSLRFNNLLSSGRSLKGNLLKKLFVGAWWTEKCLQGCQITSFEEDSRLFSSYPTGMKILRASPVHHQCHLIARQRIAQDIIRGTMPCALILCFPLVVQSFPNVTCCTGSFFYEIGDMQLPQEWHSNLWKCRQVGGFNPFEKKNSQNGSLLQVGIKIKRNFHPQSRIPPRHLGLAIHTGTAHATGKLLTGSHQGKKDDHYCRYCCCCCCYYYYYYYYSSSSSSCCCCCCCCQY